MGDGTELHPEHSALGSSTSTASSFLGQEVGDCVSLCGVGGFRLQELSSRLLCVKRAHVDQPQRSMVLTLVGNPHPYIVPEPPLRLIPLCLSCNYLTPGGIYQHADIHVNLKCSYPLHIICFPQSILSRLRPLFTSFLLPLDQVLLLLAPPTPTVSSSPGLWPAQTLSLSLFCPPPWSLSYITVPAI